MPLGTFKIGATFIRPTMSGYSGYAYEDQATVTKLLGMDPARPDKNEVIQSSGKGARSATIECYADTISERDVLVNKLWTTTTHDEGTGDAVHNVFVAAARARLWHFTGTPRWIVTMTLREV